jgi:hypothetical protein
MERCFGIDEFARKTRKGKIGGSWRDAGLINGGNIRWEVFKSDLSPVERMVQDRGAHLAQRCFECAGPSHR